MLIKIKKFFSKIKIPSIKKSSAEVKNSLRLRMTLIMTLTVVSIIIICWIMNRLLLPSYYQQNKISTLTEAFNMLNSEFDDDVIAQFDNKELSSLDELYSRVEYECDIKSIDVYIFNIFNLGMINSYVQFYYPYSMTDRETNALRDKFNAYDTSSMGNNHSVDVIEYNGQYQISKMYDHRLGSNSIELIGVLDSGLRIMISSNFESMQESAAISSNFLAYVGIIVTIIATVIVFYISRSITKPIQDLSVIAERMAELDFEARYSYRENDDEIDMLGKSMNSLSDKLKNTISELKTANSELKNDIEIKNKNEEIRKEFLSNISHELKTPIALIQGYAEGLNENINDDLESRQFYCDVIVDEAKKMNNIVMKILDLNNIESGNSPANIERFNITSLISGLITSSEILFKQKEVTVEFDCHKNIYVWADEFMIEEVLMNYISNALNHIDGDRIIKISIQLMEKVARISVFNTGNNIPREDIDKIWDKFYKVDKARTREYGGSGVGLSIVKAIMDTHGRECGVKNLEKGVEFWFDADITN